MADDDEYLKAVIQDMDDRFDLILELLDGLRRLPESVREITERLIALEDTVAMLVSVVTDQHTKLRDHQHRIRRLEAE